MVRERVTIHNTSIRRVRLRQVSLCRLSDYFGSPPRRAAELGQVKVRWVSKVRSLPSLRMSPFSQATSIICQIYRLNEIVQNIFAVCIRDF